MPVGIKQILKMHLKGHQPIFPGSILSCFLYLLQYQKYRFRYSRSYLLWHRLFFVQPVSNLKQFYYLKPPSQESQGTFTVQLWPYWYIQWELPELRSTTLLYISRKTNTKKKKKRCWRWRSSSVNLEELSTRDAICFWGVTSLVSFNFRSLADVQFQES